MEAVELELRVDKAAVLSTIHFQFHRDALVTIQWFHSDACNAKMSIHRRSYIRDSLWRLAYTDDYVMLIY